MGLIIGILATLLVIFMVAAMAIAEWADKDPGEAISDLWKKWFPQVVRPATEKAIKPAGSNLLANGKRSQPVPSVPVRATGKKTSKKIPSKARPGTRPSAAARSASVKSATKKGSGRSRGKSKKG